MVKEMVAVASDVIGVVTFTGVLSVLVSDAVNAPVSCDACDEFVSRLSPDPGVSVMTKTTT